MKSSSVSLSLTSLSLAKSSKLDELLLVLGCSIFVLFLIETLEDFIRTELSIYEVEPSCLVSNQKKISLTERSRRKIFSLYFQVKLKEQIMDFNFGEIVEPVSRAFYDDYEDASLNLPFKRFAFLCNVIMNQS